MADAEMRKFRTADVELTLAGADGSPLADREVRVSMKRHAFLFGASGFDVLAATSPLAGEQRELSERKASMMAEICNAVTLPFYWGYFEPERGKPNTEALKKAALWCAERGIAMKGHPLCWHTVCANWLLPLSTEEILQAQLARIDRDVSAFKGLVDSWDVINEAVIMPIFDKYDNGVTRICSKLGRFKTVKAMFDAARAANPAATLLLNDFDMSAAYEILIEGCLEAGIKIDVLGLQSHMHQGYWGVEKTLSILERFSRFGIPIHFTENTILSGKIMPPEIVALNDYQVKDWPSTPEGEERQAREVATHYRTLFSHPAVHGITWWDFADGKWLNAPSGLVRRDGKTKPSFHELKRLVTEEWWTEPLTLKTDAAGRVRFNGFLGDYEAAMGDRAASFRISKPGAVVAGARL